MFAVQVPAVIPRAVLFKPNPPEASDMLCEAAMRFVAGSNLALKNQSSLDSQTIRMSVAMSESAVLLRQSNTVTGG